ncbi:hypothetical protein TI39_contig4271g00001 [Zymoseptoria brevis]|uniref:F-box domain-containing protein n=1 Tax=Zymoseptoria brevis TaxID=1047168 RepID=A0A0F4G8H1_9PEZI|nr:hypothetical protein TI39_contig4271g00001 [Zymoseptoria brevis]
MAVDLAKTDEEQQPFRLLDLPDELWIKIGNMVIDDIQPKDVGIIRICTSAAEANPDDYQPEGPEEHPGYERFSFDLTPPAILQTCVSLRKELRSGYYHDKISVTVRMCWWGMDESYLLLGQYLRMMGQEARRQIKAVSDEGWHKKTDPVPAPGWEHANQDYELKYYSISRHTMTGDIDTRERSALLHDTASSLLPLHTSTETQPCYLLDLPVELLINIGQLLIEALPTIRVSDVTITRAEKGRTRNGYASHTWLAKGFDLAPPASLQTCSALRNELRSDYYRQKVTINPYPQRSSGKDDHRLGKYLQMIGPEARRSIRVFPFLTAMGKSEAPSEPPRREFSHWEVEMMFVPKCYPEPGKRDVSGRDRGHIFWEIDFI